MSTIRICISFALVLAACGQQSKAGPGHAVAPLILGFKQFVGHDAYGWPCSLAVAVDASSRLTALTFSGTYFGPYAVPMPHAPVPGRMRDERTFDSRVNTVSALQVTRSANGGSDLVTGTGPSFWLPQGLTPIDHELTVTQSLAAPASASYHGDQPYGVSGWVGAVTLQCMGLRDKDSPNNPPVLPVSG